MTRAEPKEYENVHWVLQITLPDFVKEFLIKEAKAEERTLNKHISRILREHAQSRMVGK